MTVNDLHLLTATDAVEAIVAGRISSEAVVQACLDRIAATDDEIRAWAHVDAEGALETAREMDRIRRAGRATGPLHGVPVGLKDIIDTADMPTECGTPIFAGRKPTADAEVVNRLREAGAVILGKTRTTELAFMHPTETRNPHDTARGPGGSSSGSAAAVAACQVPLALGSQTNGSVIRPASYCGTFGFKPTRGVISRRGVLQTSRSLDHVGIFARSLPDIALLGRTIGSYDPADPQCFARPRPDLVAGVRSEPGVEPVFAWFDMPFHDRLDADAREAFEALLEALGGRVERMGAAPQLAGLIEVQQTIHQYEFWMHLGETLEANSAKVSPTLAPIVERARKISQAEYEDALAVKASAEAFFAQFFIDYDAVIAPSATGEAPPFGAGTGDPIMCTIWTLAGLPSLTMPLLVGANDLPIGVQFITSREHDDRLMRTAAWVLRTLNQAA